MNQLARSLCALICCLALAGQGWPDQVALSIADVTFTENGGSFYVTATSDFAEPYAPLVYELNLQFTALHQLDQLTVDTANVFNGMQELGSAFGTSDHPLTVTEGDVVGYVTFGDAELAPEPTHLLQVSFSTPEAFDPLTQGFRVTVVPSHPSNPAVFLTFVGENIPLTLSSEVIGSLVGPTFEPCDINRDLACDVVDIDELSAAIVNANTAPRMDLNHDDAVDALDRDVWVHSLMNVYYGDTNLDDQFDSFDLVLALQAGTFENELSLDAVWETGDWDGDLEFGTGDLVLAFQDGGYETGPRPAVAVASVPEPSPATSISAALVGLGTIQRRRRTFTGRLAG